MSDVTMLGALPPVCVVARSVQAWFAPVDPVTGVAALFDPAVSGRASMDVAPAGWWSAGPIKGFARKNSMAMTEVRSGAPGVTKTLARHTVDASVSFTFASWSKLALAVSCGTRQMNLLMVSSGAPANGSGGTAQAAWPLLAGSTATVVKVSAAAPIAAGDLLVIDDDYNGQVGAVGAGVPGAVVNTSAAASLDASYIRRVSLNVARVLRVDAGLVTLAQPLPAGVPAAAMRVARVAGFADRDGDAFQRQWSAVFVIEGVQGDRILFHYPRMQMNTGATETATAVSAGLERWQLQASLTALPVVDSNDGTEVLCFRSYLPAPGRAA